MPVLGGHQPHEWSPQEKSDEDATHRQYSRDGDIAGQLRQEKPLGQKEEGQVNVKDKDPSNSFLKAFLKKLTSLFSNQK